MYYRYKIALPMKRQLFLQRILGLLLSKYEIRKIRVNLVENFFTESGATKIVAECFTNRLRKSFFIKKLFRFKIKKIDIDILF